MDESNGNSQSTLVPTGSYRFGKYPYKTFNPIQSSVIGYLGRDSNIVVSAPTASGKTICGEIIGGEQLSKRRKLVYLSPLKALAEEKYEDWKDSKHPFGKRRKAIVTGDYRLTERKLQELEKANIVLATYEMMSVRCRNFKEENSKWLTKVGCLIVDEAHFLSSEGRGDHLENALILFTKLNPTARIVFLSATLINCKEISEWLTSLNGKPTDLCESNYRPCTLTVNFLPYKVSNSVPHWERYKHEEFLKVSKILEVMEEHPEDQWLIFVHSKAMGKALKLALLSNEITVGFHNADLSRDARTALERDFRAGRLLYLIATSTLAYGVNLPARRVVIAGTTRGVNEVDPLDVIQECGRAGRPKYDTEGDAYVVLNETELSTWQGYLKDGVKVLSRLHEKIGFHLIGEIAEKRASTADQSKEWADRTLAKHQGLYDPAKIDSILSDYFDNKLVAQSQCGTFNDIQYEVTSLGRIASKNYFDPMDVVAWKKNLYIVHARELEKEDAALAWMWAAIPANSDGWIPKDMRTLTGTYLSQLRKLNLSVPTDGALAVATVFYFHLQGEDRLLDPWPSLKTPFIMDGERIVTCLSQIDNRVLSKKNEEWWNRFLHRVKYGVSWEASDLCSLDGIGKVYSEQLVIAGIRSTKELLLNLKRAGEILPQEVFKRAVSSARKILEGSKGWD